MQNTKNFIVIGALMIASSVGPLFGSDATGAEPLRVCVTVTDLASLVESVGGAHVVVSTFAKPTEDAHFVEAKPSFVKLLSRADLFVQVGLELEAGWAPVLIKNARNAGITPGSEGFLDVSQAIEAMDIPSIA